MISKSGYAALVGGAVTTIVVFCLKTWAHVDVDAITQGAVTTVVTAALGEWFPDSTATPAPPAEPPKA